MGEMQEGVLCGRRGTVRRALTNDIIFIIGETKPMKQPSNHRRRSIRLPEYNYAQPGAYFITICAHQHACLFGTILDGEMQLNEMGRVVQACWDEIPAHFAQVELDAFVVMPNHVHGIVVICEDDSIGARHACVGATHASPLPRRANGPQPKSIAAIVGSFKSAVTKRMNELRNTPGAPVWQRNYYERIIRNEAELNAVREYIANNPQRWAEDEEYWNDQDESFG
jgi:putative transposase